MTALSVNKSVKITYIYIEIEDVTKSACVQLQPSGTSRVECCDLSNVTANTAAAIFKVDVYWWILYIGQEVCEDLDVKMPSCEAEERAVIPSSVHQSSFIK
jgi:hypothetical protein